MIKIIPPKDFILFPWKNGLGETLQLAINDNANLNDFDWRLSIATVSADGEFSDFSGYQRNLVLIEGDGLELTFSDASGKQTNNQLKQHLDFATFDGGTTTTAQLYSGPIKDFNLMTKKGLYSEQVATYKARSTIKFFCCELVFIYSTDSKTTLTCRGITQEIASQHLIVITEPDTSQIEINGNNLIIIQLNKLSSQLIQP